MTFLFYRVDLFGKGRSFFVFKSHILKKAEIAIPFLPYRKPKIAGSVKELPEIIMRHKCTHVLIITDGGIMKLGLTRRLEKALKEAGIPYTIYDKTVANPTTVNVREALELYHKEGCDAIIGFGGGSSMDCAKAVGACAVKPNQSLAQMKGILKVHKSFPFSWQFQPLPEQEVRPLSPL